MDVLKNAKKIRSNPLIVTADALTATPRNREYTPRGTLCLFEGEIYEIEMGSAREANFPEIGVGQSMLMQLRLV